MATLSQIDPNQARQDLQGYGTALTGALVDKYGQTFGGGKDINSYLAGIQKYDPNASLQDQTNSEGSYSGSILNFDPSKLPPGILEAITGPKGGVELSDPDSHYGTSLASKSDYKAINPNLIGSDPIYGQHTSQSNIYETPDKFTDVGTWGPLVASLVAGGAASGLIGGFGGMSDAAAQGLVSGATGSGLTGGAALPFGLSPNQASSAFQGVGRGAQQGSPLSSLSSLLPLLGQGLGLPSYASTLGRLALSQATGGKP